MATEENMGNVDQTESLQLRDQQSIWHPFTPLADAHKIVSLKSAKGAYLHTTDGRKILDAIGSWWVNLHGHANEYIAEKIAGQARTLEHVIFAGFTHEPAITLAERLLAILPAGMSKIFYSDNGSTAVEVALKMAFQYWHNQGIAKRKIIALDGAYHGDTFGAMAVGERGAFTAPFQPFLFEVEFLSIENPKFGIWNSNQKPETGGHEIVSFENAKPAVVNSEFGIRNSELIRSFTHSVQSGDVAAFIYEPLVQGAAGMRMYAPEMLDELLQIAKQHNIICIADEVMTGFGRTGKLFASDHCATKPDIICLSKGLTGGTLPLGVTACTAEVMRPYRSDDLMKTFFHGHSFTGNPLACAAANASLDLLLAAGCQNSILEIAQTHAAFAAKIASHPAVLDVRHMGVILALEIKTNAATSYFNELRNSLYDYFLERNLLLRPLGNVIYVLPPYIITIQELEWIYTEIEQLLDIMCADEAL